MTELMWTPLSEREYDDIWTRFYDRFAFKPSYYSSGWPGFAAPAPSITFDLSQIDEGAASAACSDSLNAEALRCMVTAPQAPARWVALDWQHEAYSFEPATTALAPQPGWPISVYPDGDYYAFVTPDLSMGTFGHPWEQTLCVFGEPMVATLGAALETWLPVVRRNDVTASE